MVFRLFVQPGEGKHWIVPKRHEPLAANATLQNSVIASTAIAAGYTSYARNFSKRLGYNNGQSIPGIFIRSSARAGIWCACVGAVANWYYHYSFTAPVVLLSGVEHTPYKIWERTEKYTVDDGFLAGAGLGLASALFLRRIPISWWAKFVGMGNLGAFTGVTASHAWFHYKGERQPSVAALEEWHKRRNLEFHWVYWNKLFMSKLSPAAQGYVILNGIFKSNSLPEEAYQTPEKFGIVGIADSPTSDESTTADGTTEQPEIPYTGYYTKPYDHAENLRNIDVQNTREKMADMEIEKKNLWKESEFILTEMVKRQYDYCHTTPTEEDERQRCQREIQILEISYNRIRLDADYLDRKLLLWEKSLKQKAAWASEADGGGKLEQWFPKITRVNPDTHDPTLSIQEVTKTRDQLVKDIANFQEQEKTATGTNKANIKQDLEDARTLLRAADRIVFELEKRAKLVEGTKSTEKTEEQSHREEVTTEKAVEKGKDEIKQVEGKGTEDVQKPVEKGKARPSNDMEPSKP
ncbi:hypothetical protein B0J11DRAFT_515769 [Dendryphion nanum]|uniref:Uncharacterized protein n=1 Tax=Dendryphion nanum TaxID=256645 RepID=A0A9P9EL13_9PLEO|nr:hypothetical protein B0J11DRAFT_515769 [Dendryphion nanum]